MPGEKKMIIERFYGAVMIGLVDGYGWPRDFIPRALLEFYKRLNPPAFNNEITNTIHLFKRTRFLRQHGLDLYINNAFNKKTIVRIVIDN